MDKEQKIETIEEKKKANRLCIISILLFVCPIIFKYIFYFIVSIYEQKIGINIQYDTYYNFDALDNISRIFTVINLSLNFIGALSMMSSFGVLIFIRVKYPLNIFAKVLMWLYISMFIVLTIFIIILIIACNVIIDGCVRGGSEFLEVWRNCY